MLGSHRGDDIHRLGRLNLVASDSSPKVRHQSIPFTFAHSVLYSTPSTKRLYISIGDISKVIVVKWWSMAIKKKKLRKCFFHTILLNVWRQSRKKYKRRKVWDKALFQEKENKGAFHQTLQNIRVSDREAHFKFIIT